MDEMHKEILLDLFCLLESCNAKVTGYRHAEFVVEVDSQRYICEYKDGQPYPEVEYKCHEDDGWKKVHIVGVSEPS